MTGLPESVIEGVNQDGQESIVIRRVNLATMVRTAVNIAVQTAIRSIDVTHLQESVVEGVNQDGQG